MPESRVATPRAVRRSQMAERLASVWAGERPRSPSLPPSSTRAAWGRSASAQSSRAKPPALVSPETPAFSTRALSPSAAWSCGTKPSPGGRPKPAVRLSPSARRRIGSAAKAILVHPNATTAFANAALRPYAVAPRNANGAMDAIETHPQPLAHPLAQPLPARAASESVIAAEGLRFSVTGANGPVNILRRVDLVVSAGEAVGLVGPSGSGKTSLLMLLAGLERPTGGSLRVAGHDPAG